MSVTFMPKFMTSVCINIKILLLNISIAIWTNTKVIVYSLFEYLVDDLHCQQELVAATFIPHIASQT